MNNHGWYKALESRFGKLCVVAALFLSGCTNLDAVGKFARISSDSAAYQQVINEYASSPERTQWYESERQASHLEQLIKLRSQQKLQFERVQTVLVEYMSALGELADGRLSCVDDRINAISSALLSSGFIGDTASGSGKRTVSAAASIAGILVRSTLDHWRQRQVVKIIRESDVHVQAVIAGLKELLDRDLRASLQNEEIALSKPFQAWQASAKSHNDGDGAARIAGILLHERRSNVQAGYGRLDAYIRILDTIGKGHADLNANVDRIDSKQLIVRLQGYSRELVTLQKSISALSK